MLSVRETSGYNYMQKKNSQRYIYTITLNAALGSFFSSYQMSVINTSAKKMISIFG